MVGQRKECMETRKCLFCKQTHTVALTWHTQATAEETQHLETEDLENLEDHVWLAYHKYIQGECHTLVYLVWFFSSTVIWSPGLAAKLQTSEFKMIVPEIKAHVCGYLGYSSHRCHLRLIRYLTLPFVSLLPSPPEWHQPGFCGTGD